jgi:molybdopterin molybdotransferase
LAGLLSIEEAQRRVLARVQRLPAERVALAEAGGRVLAEPAHAAVDLPPFPSSAMDGFVVRAADTPGTLPVAERIAAGRPASRALQPGEAMAIATGAVVPDGADAVVPVENVVDRGDTVEIPEAAREGAHVRPRGGDVRAGDEIVAAGERLGAAQLGGLAAAGVAAVACGGRPRVAVLTTGTELRRPGESLEPGQIYEANSVTLVAAIAAAGAAVERLEAVVDDPGVHRAAIERGLEADVLVTSGGVSMGPHDLVRRVAADLGVEEDFWGVAMRPGKPLSFGVRGRTLLFGLPGNPVSSLVGALLFVRPAVLALQGFTNPLPRFRGGVLDAALRRNANRDELVRARSREDDGRVLLEPLSGQESHMIARAAGADALVWIPRGDGEVAAGAAVRYLPLD